MKYSNKFYALIYPAWVEQPDIVGDEPSFSDPREAWAWLRDARKVAEDRCPVWNVGEYTPTVQYLDYAATEHQFGSKLEDWHLARDGAGVITGATPGVGDHAFDGEYDDPGVAYAVVKVESR